MNLGENSEFCGILGIVHVILKTNSLRATEVVKTGSTIKCKWTKHTINRHRLEELIEKINKPTMIQLYAGYKRPTLDSKTQMDWK